MRINSNEHLSKKETNGKKSNAHLQAAKTEKKNLGLNPIEQTFEQIERNERKRMVQIQS